MNQDLSVVERVIELSIVVCLGSVVVAGLGVLYLLWRRYSSLQAALERLEAEGLQGTERALFRALAAEVSAHEVQLLIRVRGVFDRAADRWLRRRPRDHRPELLGSLLSLRRRVPFDRSASPSLPRIVVGDRLMLRFERQDPMPVCVIRTAEEWLQLGLWRRRPGDVSVGPGARVGLLVFHEGEVLEAVLPLLAAGRDRCWQLRVPRPKRWQAARIRVGLKEVEGELELELPERGDESDDASAPSIPAMVEARAREGIVVRCERGHLEPGERVTVRGGEYAGAYSRFVSLGSDRRGVREFLLRQSEAAAPAAPVASVEPASERAREEVPA